MEICISDCRLHCEEAGSGEPLVLLHGNGEDSGYFVHQMEYFSAKYRVIALDTRGHGASERGTAPFSIAQFAEDLRCALEALELGPVHLLGFSDGGNIAMAFALRYPGMVRSLILNGANLRPCGVKLTVQAPIVLGYWMCRALEPFSKRAGKHKEMLGLMVTQPHVAERELKAIRVPALVIAGDRDMIRESHTKRIARGITGSRLVILKGDHFVAGKNAAEFNRAVEEFLRAL
ncbi:MAG: alpha/beta hydrolase [Clostridium sp.]|nr:alpha/beta hydrolase [Clostridium sp.]